VNAQDIIGQGDPDLSDDAFLSDTGVRGFRAERLR
jgi:hypothetical protein